MPNKIFRPKVDLNTYSNKKNLNPQVYYGLPENIQFCKKCVISNQRPNSVVEYDHRSNSKKETINFDENQICDACLLTLKKNNDIAWEDREDQLLKLCDKYRKNDGSYDCIVPGSGGKDSVFASHILKNKYGMHPLTVTWSPHIYTEWGWKNFNSWIHSGNDNYLLTPNGRVHKLLTRLSTELLFHPFQAFMIGQKSIAPKMAAKFNIPLVFYGENEAEYGNPILTSESAKRDPAFYTAKKIKETHLGGVATNVLINEFGLSMNDLTPYLPMDFDEYKKTNIEIHYLGYYLKWHPQSCYYYAVENANFEASPERTPGTYSKYNSIDDKIDDLHYFTTGIKFGIGRATYDASQEIRSGDITRDEGVALVKKFDHEFPHRFIKELYEYLSISKSELRQAYELFDYPHMDEEYFMDLSNYFRSPHLWQFEGDSWKLRKAVWHQSEQG